MFFCKCLNVSLTSNKNREIEKVDHKLLQLSDAEKNEPFFKQDIGKILLETVSNEQPSLVHSYVVGDWVVHQCWNCGIFTHALRKDQNISDILISCKLLVNCNEVTSLRKSDQYSAAFRIVVNHNDTDYDADLYSDKTPDIFSVRKTMEGGNPSLANLQHQLSQAVKTETQATEERVRKYTEQQYALLDDYREKARRDHRTLVRLILSNQATYNNTNCMQKAYVNTDRIETPPSNVDIYSMETSEKKVNEINKQPVSKPKTNSNSNSTQMKRSSSSTVKSISKLSNSIRGASFDCEGLFDFDGMDDGENLQKLQSELESDNDDYLEQDSGSQSTRYKPHDSSLSNTVAKSLPISVPAFMSPYNRDIVDIDDDDQAPDDQLDIAASIKALAKSVHGDAVFGDLPRPRFSTQI